LRLHSIHRKDRRQYHAHKRSKTLHDLGSRIRVPYLKRRVIYVLQETLTGAIKQELPRTQAPRLRVTLAWSRRSLRRGRRPAVPSYVMLAKWSDQGFRSAKESPRRLDAAKKALKDMGGEFKPST